MDSRKSKTIRSRLLTALVLGGVLAGMMTLQACDVMKGENFLKKPPTQTTNVDTIFSDIELAERFLTNTYVTLPYGPGPLQGNPTPYDRSKIGRDVMASMTDLNHSYKDGGVPQYYYTGALTSSANGSNTKYNFYDSGAWDGIRQAHIFLDNVDRVPGMSESLTERRKAEARMIIALHYVDMYRHYGGLPWVDKAYRPTDDFELPRMTARATLDSTVALIDRAIPHLPLVLDNPSRQSGRFTKAGALGLKARLLLFAASPLFNSSSPYMQGEAASQELVWMGGEDPQLWQRAADAAREAINQIEGPYHLVDTGNPREDFRRAYYDRDSPEVLISTRATHRAGTQLSNDGLLSVTVARGGVGNTTDNYVKMFPMASGLPIDDPNSGYDPQNPYQFRDPRLYETVLVNGDEYQGRTAELWNAGREGEEEGEGNSTRSGYRMRKFVLDVTSRYGTIQHWPLLRLPEIYLSYAEALNEVNGGPTAEAYKYVNKVRNRVDLQDLPQGLSQSEFRDAVLRERALEFGYEEVRWYDMVRHKRKEAFTKTLYGMDITRNNDGSFNYDRFELPSRYWQDNWSPKWYLSPFPREEIVKDYGLVQNPGW